MITPNQVAVDELLADNTAEYNPSAYYSLYPYGFHRNRPPFTPMAIREMLVDPRISFGLRLIKGPLLSRTRFNVETKNEELKTYVEENLKRFWLAGAIDAMSCIEWGYCGSEVFYRIRNDKIQYSHLRVFEATDVRPVTLDGRIVGMTVQNIKDEQENPLQKLYLGAPKMLWTIHERRYHPIFGRSRLYPVHVVWNEIWSDGGFRDIRRLWFYKNAYEGGTMYHPPGQSRLQNGQMVSNKDLARELMEKKRSGGVLTLPSTATAEGARQWEYEPPKPNTVPTGLREYGEDLRYEILEAMGIPPEVIESQSSEGFGSSTGRAIPQEAYYSTLFEIAQSIVFDFVDQILTPLTNFYFANEEYDVTVQPITSEANQLHQENQEIQNEQREFENQRREEEFKTQTELEKKKLQATKSRAQ